MIREGKVEVAWAFLENEKGRDSQGGVRGKLRPSPEGVEYHGEEDELAQKRDDQRGRRDDLGEQQEEHSQ